MNSSDVVETEELSKPILTVPAFFPPQCFQAYRVHIHISFTHLPKYSISSHFRFEFEHRYKYKYLEHKIDIHNARARTHTISFLKCSQLISVKTPSRTLAKQQVERLVICTASAVSESKKHSQAWL